MAELLKLFEALPVRFLQSTRSITSALPPPSPSGEYLRGGSIHLDFQRIRGILREHNPGVPREEQRSLLGIIVHEMAHGVWDLDLQASRGLPPQPAAVEFEQLF